MREREYGAQHHPVQAEDVDRAEAEQDSGAVGDQTDDDVVGEDLQRQDRRGHDIQQSFRPQLTLLDRSDQLGRCEQRDQPRVRTDQQIAGGHRQHEDRRRPDDVEPEVRDDSRQIIPEQGSQGVAEVPCRLVKRGVCLSVGRLEVFPGRGVALKAAGGGQIARQQPVAIQQKRCILAVCRMIPRQPPRPLRGCLPRLLTDGHRLGKSGI